MKRKLLGFLSISTGVAAIMLGLIVLQRYQPQMAAFTTTVQPPSDPFLNTSIVTPEPVQVASAKRPLESAGTTVKRNMLIRPQPTLTPKIPYMEFNGVSILESPMVMTFQPGCGQKTFNSPEFRVIPWVPDAIDKGEFDISKRTAVAWEHLGYTGLWIHSGMDWLGNPLAAAPLQNYLEKIDGRVKRTPQEFDKNAADCLIGSKVSVQLGEKLLEGKVTAIVRIPASDVETVSTHVMDLVPYLAKTYPESGFDKLKAPELLLYFCGRLLTTETPDYSIPDYSRTRIIVAIDFGT